MRAALRPHRTGDIARETRSDGTVRAQALSSREPSPVIACESAACPHAATPCPAHRTGSWTNCDLPGILGLLRFLGAASSTAASPRWLWTLDWDVGWTGNLADILASFAGAPHDFLAGGTPHPADKASWVYFGLRSHLRDDEVWQTLVVV